VPDKFAGYGHGETSVTNVAAAAGEGREKITPMGDRVVVLPDEPEGVTKGGIILPDQAKKIPVRGVVIAAGPGKRTEATGVLIPMDVKVGDRVLYTRYAGETIESGGKEYKILHEKDVSAKLG
jgi:chaperonin GroES